MQKLDGPYIEPQSGKAKQLVVFLHGYGSNGDDLISIGRDWGESLPDCAFVSPNAPDVCEAFAGGYQWFSIRAAEITQKTMDRKELVQRPFSVLSSFIDQQLAHWSVNESAVAVIGFSQGAMMAMYAMPRRASPCAGVIGYSGMLIDAEGLKQEEIVRMPVLAIHGDADEVVPSHCLTAVYAGFRSANFEVETILRPNLGHGIDQFGITRGLEFIQEGFEKAEK